MSRSRESEDLSRSRASPRMAADGGEGEENSWKSYYEHPLTAATTAMLNISGGEEQPSNVGMLYDYYKSPAERHEKQPPDIWVTSVASSGGGALVTSLPKVSNGVADGMDPLGPHELGMFLSSGGGVKREPEDLTAAGSRRTPEERPDSAHVVDSSRIPRIVVVNGEPAIVKEEPGSPQRQPSGHLTVPHSIEAGVIVPTTDLSKNMSSTVQPYPSQVFPSVAGQSGYEHPQYGVLSPAPPNAYTSASASSIRSSGGVYTVSPNDPYYREYYSSEQYAAVAAARQQLSYADGQDASAFVERYIRGNAGYKTPGHGLTVDLPSPDSGIGAEAVTPRDQTGLQQTFDYAEMCQSQLLTTDPSALGGRSQAGTPGPGRSRPWHDFGRQNEIDKIQIPKVYSNCGFRYFMESPISTSQRREDDRITYINKGQFYGITLEYIPDPDKPLKSTTVKSLVMLMFREEKTSEDEIKAWQFWHGRQHSVKQRILDVDTKNSVGLVGCIEEVAHNAIAVYWNPMESPAKINVAVQCLSTDFSSQKGVKGLPLHIQIDTHDEYRESGGAVFHRGYCQIKVFCDKGAERKTRDEERRAAKRKMTATGRKKLEELYHPPGERSEFYAMADLTKQPVLFSPAEDIDKIASMELQGYYTSNNEDGGCRGADGGEGERSECPPATAVLPDSGPTTPVNNPLKFHYAFPAATGDPHKEVEASSPMSDGMFVMPPKRAKLTPPPSERLMLYVRQETDDVFTPLHLVPPTTSGLLSAIENKYKISAANIQNLFRKNKKGVVAAIDEEMLRHYCNEDTFLLQVNQLDREERYDVTLIETMD